MAEDLGSKVNDFGKSMFSKGSDKKKTGLEGIPGLGGGIGRGGEDVGSAIGGFLSDSGIGLDDAIDAEAPAGAITPQFKSKEEANASLMNDIPKWVSEGIPEAVGMDEKTNSALPSMTHIRNWVRAEFLRREHNFGMYYTSDGEHAEVKFDSFNQAAMTSGGNPWALKEPFTESHMTKGKMETFHGASGMKRYHTPPVDGDAKAQIFMEDGYVSGVYKGPKAAWCRVTSNGMTAKNGPDMPADEKDAFEGFIMHGVENFHDIYGFTETNNPKSGESILGYDCNGKPHTVKEMDFKHRPMPGITSITSEDSGVGRNMKKTTINFTVWSRSQVDYMDQYFFKVGSTLCCEWGWNNFPREALIDVSAEGVGSKPAMVLGKNLTSGDKKKVNKLRLTDYDKELIPITEWQADVMYTTDRGSGMIGLWNAPYNCKQQIRKGKGNYSFCMGMISTYNYSMREDGGFDCTIEIMSMAHFATCLMDDASKTKGTGADTKDTRTLEFRVFVDRKLQEILDGDEDPNELWDVTDDHWTAAPGNWALSVVGYDVGGDQGYTSAQNQQNAEDWAKPDFAMGRFFSFGNLGYFGNEDGKDHMRSDAGDGSYMTLGFFVEILNIFYQKASMPSGADIFKFDVGSSRCVAHPNIKSTDGKVLLIPNALAPRHNKDQYGSSTVGYGWGSKKSAMKKEDYDTSSESFEELYGDPNSAAAKAFVAVASGGSVKGSSRSKLRAAMKHSPRDDLHRIMTLNPSQSFESDVDPFPDYRVIDGYATEGYSGRVQDLFVNYDVIKDAVANNSTADKMLKTILKKITSAAGGIWDFDLVGGDPGSATNATLRIVDQKLPAINTVDEIQRSDQTYVFKAHQKNSIVKSMGMDVSVPGEIASMVLFPPGEDKDAAPAFYSRGKYDRILQVAGPVSTRGQALAKKDGQADPSKGPSEEKFVVGMVVHEQGDIETTSKATGEDQGGFWEGVAEFFGDPNGDVIDIELVDPDPSRMKRGMMKDQNPKNSIKYNMTLDGIELSMQLDGIEGLRLWDMFNCTGVPTNYYQNGLWRITAIKHSISENNWTTDITAQFAPNSNEVMLNKNKRR